MFQSALPEPSNSIITGQLQSSLAGSVAFGPTTPGDAAVRQLRDHNFDRVPIIEDEIPIG
jgi:hypothetical protein